MSAYKRFLVLFALAFAVGLGTTRPADAQVVVAGPHVAVGVGFGWGYPYYCCGPLYAAPWGPYPYAYPPYHYLSPPDSSVRLEVTPRQAQVFVDGYYAGIVDDFDGTFQRLHTTPGAHEIELYLDGYKTARQQVYLPANETFKVKYAMVKLAAGEPQDARPEPVAPAANSYPPENYPPQQGNYPPQQGNYPPQGSYPPPGNYPPQGNYPPPGSYPPPQQGGGQYPPQGRITAQPGAPPPTAGASYGTLSVRVQPGEAQVSIDGEEWHSPDQSNRLIVEIAAGSHTVEIRKPGFRTYVTQVDVKHGQTTPLNVSLRQE